MKSSLLVLIALALTLLVNCSPLRQVVTQLDALTPQADAMLTIVEEQYAKELRAADNPETVKRKYDRIFESYRAFRASWQAAREALAFASISRALASSSARVASATMSVSARFTNDNHPFPLLNCRSVMIVVVVVSA